MSWTYDQASQVWKCTKYTDLSYAAINNFAEYGQPVSPSDPGYDPNLKPNFGNIIIEMPQQEVMTNGYGQKITVHSFPLVRRLLWDKLAIPFGTYTLEKLLQNGTVRDAERRITSSLYTGGAQGITSGSISAKDAAYIHGEVGFALMKQGTRLIYAKLSRRVEAEIGALDDNWDFHSRMIPDFINALVDKVLGPGKNRLTAPIKIQYRGMGKVSIAEQRTPSWPMFRFFERP